MILHHYSMSPFSEKIRLMLGYAGVDWQGVITPEMPPRPDVDPLAGGYRRIPVAQLGADIFCDTRVISAEISALAGMPELDPANCDEAALGFSSELEGDVFWACVASIPAQRVLRQLFRNLSFVNAIRFIVDRAGVARDAVTKPMPPKHARQVFNQHLQELEGRLAAGGPFLVADTPCHLDFAAYHTLWFQREVGELPAPPGIPGVLDWYQRMGQFGHGEHSEISAGQAFASARDTEPRPVPARMTEDARIGEIVCIQPADYALDGSEGVLVGSSDTRWIIARESEQAGRVHVHFPRQGFRFV